MGPKIDPDIRALIPDLTSSELEELSSSLQREGCRDALVTWRGVLLDGHNRLRICEEFGIAYETREVNIGEQDVRVWVIRNQFARRNLTTYQRAELALKMDEILRPAAKERMLAGKKLDPVTNSQQGRVDRDIAKSSGLGSNTISRARVLREKAPESVKESLRRGDTTINHEYQKLRAPGLLLSSSSVEWYTPSKYIEAAREVLGGIDLDPASCREANLVVKAHEYYSYDGITKPWLGRIWLNPPYGGSQASFSKKLVDSYLGGLISSAILLVNSNSTDTEWFKPLWDRILCFTDHRINFLGQTGSKNNSTHGSVFVYFGSDEQRFIQKFRIFGAIVKRVDI